MLFVGNIDIPIEILEPCKIFCHNFSLHNYLESAIFSQFVVFHSMTHYGSCFRLVVCCHHLFVNFFFPTVLSPHSSIK